MTKRPLLRPPQPPQPPQLPCLQGRYVHVVCCCVLGRRVRLLMIFKDFAPRAFFIHGRTTFDTQQFLYFMHDRLVSYRLTLMPPSPSPPPLPPTPPLPSPWAPGPLQITPQRRYAPRLPRELLKNRPPIRRCVYR